ncbi:MAG: AAA family ATPase [Candidatus Omnitrophota bacterium]|jgi:chromosome partitioning protein
MKTISIANQKGGCGKTTTAINLASALAISGKKILLIDLDPQSHASYGLGIMNQTVNKSVYNILTDNPDKTCLLSECIMHVSQNLDIAPSNILLSTLEQELKDKEDAVSRLYDVITSSQLNYDYILIDCPPSLGFLTFNALRAADMILVPIDMSAFSLMGVAKLLGMLELIKVKIGHSPRVNSLATIFDKRTKYSETMLNEIKSLFKEQLLTTIIRMNVALKKAVSKGISVIQFDKESNGAQDHLALAKEILKIDEEEASRAEKAKAVMVIAETPAPQIENSTGPESVSVNTSAILEDTVRSIVKDVVFAINAPAAREIYVAGDFNQWKVDESARLTKSEDGKWEKRVNLSPGRYKYKFIVDGEWVVDSQNPEREPNRFGTFDSIAKLE